MAKRLLPISLSVVCIGITLLWGPLSHASETHTAGGGAGSTDTGSQPRNEMLRAFTRELAFIRTFAVSTPAQYEQKGQDEGLATPGSTGRRIAEEEIQPREYRSDGAAKTKDASGGKPGKKTKGRRK